VAASASTFRNHEPPRTIMKLGISTWVWTSPATTEVLETLIPHIASLGYDVVELPVESTEQFDVQRVRTIAESSGIEVSVCAVISSGRDFLIPDEVDAGIAYLEWCIDAAQGLGSPVVAGPFYSAVGRCWTSTATERERDLDVVAEVLVGLGRYGEARGVSLAVETLNRFETSFLNTTEQALELVQRVDHPNVGLCLDLFHLGIEEKSLGRAVRAAGRHLKHVQVAENDRGTPGSGQLGWIEFAGALKEIGYDGRVVIETFSDRVEAIARAAAIWRPLASDPDTLAREGLDFLQRLFAAP
jgi:D-psicose/D-tagatose/L-ribulose 3-epimerase